MKKEERWRTRRGEERGKVKKQEKRRFSVYFKKKHFEFMAHSDGEARSRRLQHTAHSPSPHASLPEATGRYLGLTSSPVLPFPLLSCRNLSSPVLS